MGSLDQATGAKVRREIRVVNVSGKTPQQIQDDYNSNYGQNGWRIIQVIVLNNAPYVIAEREV